MKRYIFTFFVIFLTAALTIGSGPCEAQVVDPLAPGADYPLFNDKLMIDGYSLKLANASKEMLLAMINDDLLVAYRKAAAVRVFREKFASQVVMRERAVVEKVLLRQLEKASAVYVQVEMMHTLVALDRYRYFDAMIPELIQKIDHYDTTVSELAYKSVSAINESGSQRPREARIEFDTLRKMFFLTRRKLDKVDQADPRLKGKIDLLRWTVKVLGTDEIRRLPKEVINLM